MNIALLSVGYTADESTGLCGVIAATDIGTHLSEWVCDSKPSACSWRGVTCSGGHVRAVNVSYVGLSGTLPTSIGKLIYLTSLTLSKNKLQGSIPSSWMTLTALRSLVLSSNSLTNVVPDMIGSLTALVKLNLNKNSLSSSIPTVLAMCSLLGDLSLGFNNRKHSTGIRDFAWSNVADDPS